MKKTVLLVIALVVIVAAFAACGAANSVEGKWYDKAGVTGTLEFKSGGVVTMSVMGISLDGTYTFDAAKNAGTLKVSFGGQEQTTDFTLANGEINLSGSVYTKTVVEQTDLSGILQQSN